MMFGLAPVPTEGMQPHELLLALAVILIAAKIGGQLAEYIGQPAVLGELLAGILLGPSLLNAVNPADPVLHFLAELGVIILLFEIGLETDLRKMLRVGPAAVAVAITGVVLPFGLGYGAATAFGLDTNAALITGAALTATSVGITARVLADLGHLNSPEGQIILGAAVIDDVVGLIILALVSQLVAGAALTAGAITQATLAAFGFLIGAVFIGRLILPPVFNRIGAVQPHATAVVALALAFLTSSLAHQFGSAPIIGAFAAGLVLAPSPQAHAIQTGVSRVAMVLVPVFFVSVGAAVDVRVFGDRSIVLLGLVLVALGAAGKFAAGYTPFWYRGRKAVIGAGMVPRGEVGLIFAQRGLDAGALSAGVYGALTFMVLGTTFMAPPALRALLRKREGPADERSAVASVTTDI